MNPFVSSQISQIIESIRLLEAFVTTPLGLYSDIKMLRESLPFPAAADLSREEMQERRIAYAQLSDAPNELVLGSISSLYAALEVVSRIKGVDEVEKLKTDWVPRARKVLARAEQKVATEIRSTVASAVTGLYVIVDPEASHGRPIEEIAEATLKGGSRVIQLRDKTRDKGEVLQVAGKLKDMCEGYGALFVMNDDADIARACGAHGLHVGQTDLPVADARAVLESKQILGRSNGTLQEAMDSQARGVDYIAVGAVYSTSTMGKSGRTAVGPELIRKVKDSVPQPIVAIGGINAGNIADVVKAGADCVCVVSAVTFADDPEQATRNLVDLMHDAV